MEGLLRVKWPRGRVPAKDAHAKVKMRNDNFKSKSGVFVSLVAETVLVSSRQRPRFPVPRSGAARPISRGDAARRTRITVKSCTVCYF